MLCMFERAAFAAVVSVATGVASPSVIYVDRDAVGLADGSSWADAFPEPGAAFAAASPGDQIWIATGRYVPPLSGWTINEGLTVFGGFAGRETDASERDPLANPTVFDADTLANDAEKGPDTESDNAERLLLIDAPGGAVVLSGLVIKSAEGLSAVDVTADGLLVDRCRFLANRRTVAEDIDGLDTSPGAAIMIREAVATAVVRDSRFEDGLAFAGDVVPGYAKGGAIWTAADETTIVRCEFIDNVCLASSGTDGGGIFWKRGALEVRNSEFVGNIASGGDGGAIQGRPVEANPGDGLLVTDSRFEGNWATQATFGSGGAIDIIGPRVSIVRCDFLGNIATGDGGAVYVLPEFEAGPEVDIRIVASRFIANSSGDEGGAIWLNSRNDGPGFMRLDGCLIAQNSAANAGGAYLGGGGTVTNCTVASNDGILTYFGGAVGGGLLAQVFQSAPDPELVVSNSVFWGNLAAGATDENAQYYATSNYASAVVGYSIIENWTGLLGGVGNAGGDPLFADPDGADDAPGTPDDDYSPLAGSPAIDAGDTGVVPSDAFDLDDDGDTAEPMSLDAAGNDRLADDPATPDTGVGPAPVVDIGAFEFQAEPTACLADLDGDGVLDLTDISLFITAFTTQDPAADLDGSGVLDLTDISLFITSFTAGCP